MATKKKIIPFGQHNTPDRELWILKKLKSIPKGKTILDAGAGEQTYKKYCNHLNYTSQDFGQYTGKNIEDGLQMENWNNPETDILSDIIDMPIKNNSYDAIMCIEVLEHLPKPSKAIKEFSRIIKKGGHLIITAPFCSMTHFAPFYFANGYSKYWYEKILEENGFKIQSLEFNGNYFSYLAQEIHRLPHINHKYSGGDELNRKEKKTCANMISILEDMSKNDNNSNELLCFGLHVHARKK